MHDYSVKKTMDGEFGSIRKGTQYNAYVGMMVLRMMRHANI